MRTLFAALAVVSLAMAGNALAQWTGRDPTQPPAAYAPKAAPKAPVAAESFRPEQVLKVNGRTYLLWRGRRYAVGDMLQGARIERIEESEVWLRTDNGLRKLPMFAGVEKKREGTK